MAELSPAAQAVLHAANRQPRYGCHASWIADALRALADQVVPVDRGSRRQMNIRSNILTIAAELEGQADG